MTLGPHERIDDLGRKGFRIIQDTKTFCFGMDAVLLAEFARILPTEKTADLGCGNGILPLLLKSRDKGGHIDALEIQPRMAQLARRNMALNQLETEVRVVEGDLRDMPPCLEKNSYDAVISNPPYLKLGAGLINPGEAKAIARHEVSCSLEDVLLASSRLLKPGGSFFMVYRCWRMAEVMALLPACGFRARRLRLVSSFPGSEGELFLLESRKGNREGLKVEPPLILYEAPGRFTDEIWRVYYGKDREREKV